jgi:hypothetical protein
MIAGNTWTAEQEAAFKQPILTKYEKESHAFYSSARLWDDGIIDPAETRKVRSFHLVRLFLIVSLYCRFFQRCITFLITYYFSSILPKVLGLSFALSMKNAPFPDTKFGVFRM